MSTRSRKSWGVWGALAVLVSVGVFFVALWQVPWWMDENHLEHIEPAQATAVTGVRTALLALGAGGLAAVGVIYTHRTLHQNREGQVTDRYTKAIGQVASDKPVEQLGGIYALERIMRDSVKDHATIVEVLAAFVRSHATAPVETATKDHLRLARQRLRAGAPIASTHSRHTADNAYQRPTESVQAALTVLGRRPRDGDEPFQLDLARTDLRGAKMTNGYLKGASLEGTQLQGARLDGAHLEGAHLEKANLDGVRLDGAILPGAHLHGADLKKARVLTVEQLVSARPTQATVLPAHLAKNAKVLARIAAVMREQSKAPPY
ncbi:pentapeptide repeat-containing protein [Streptomyces sp. NPDC093225]|uniref:pentapeptide repeat-containing protein n=1 Tax=Streptomyces sp. NPDC093225 TaxID=3366034 RepID=UPI0037F30299